MSTMGGQTVSTLHFSTRALPPGQRLAAVRNLFDQRVQLEIDMKPGRAVEMSMSLFPGVRRARMLSPLTAEMNRSRSMLADGEDTVCLMINMGGHLRMAQNRREACPALGEASMLVYRDPAKLQFEKASYLSVRVPYSALALAHNVGAAAARTVPRNNEALTLLKTYVSSLPDHFSEPELARLSATHIYDLMAMVIGASDEGRETARQRGIRAARRKSILAELCRQPDLGLEQVAAKHGISQRYIQMLFEDIGTTFSEFALEQRLQASHHMLTSPRYKDWSITAIALEAGFGDISYFNRRFKRRFQMTPTDLRALSAP